MSSFLEYGKDPQFTGPGQPDFIDHYASNQYFRRKVASGDEIFIVDLDDRLKGNPIMILKGRIIVDRVVSQDEAEAHFNCRAEDIWPARYHVLAPVGRAEPACSIRLPSELTQELEFDSKMHPFLPKVWDGKSLQTLRTLTSESASALRQFIPTSRERRARKPVEVRKAGAE
jgi:hypothetical protein